MTWRRLLDEPRDRSITVHLSTTTDDELATAALRSRVSRAELARYLVRYGLDQLAAGRIPQPEPVIVEDDDEPAEPPKPAPKRRGGR